MFFDKEGKKISQNKYAELLELGESYSVIEEVVFEDDLEIPLTRIRIEWVGKHPDIVPLGLETPFHITMHNWVGGKWVREPITSRLSQFHKLETAETFFDGEVERLSLRFKTAEVKSLTTDDKDDLEDYGEEVVPKDIPRTKSSKLGAW